MSFLLLESEDNFLLEETSPSSIKKPLIIKFRKPSGLGRSGNSI